MKVKAEVFGIDAFEKATQLRPFRWAAKLVLNRQVKLVHKEIKDAVEETYSTPNPIDKVTTITKATSDNLQAGLSYRYESQPLSDFPLYVKHLRGPIYRTYVKVRKDGGFKPVQGREDFKFGGFYQSKPDHIFERDQRATWAGNGQRASYSRLYGPSVSEMVTSQAVSKQLGQSKLAQKLGIVIQRTLDEQL